MEAYRPDRVVRVLNTLVSIAYFGLWIVTVVVLIAGPAAKLMAGDHHSWTWALEIPVTIRESEAAVQTSWGPARLVVDDARAMVRLPIVALPWGVVGVLWTHAAVGLGLILLSLHHLRRIFRRVRDGAPFDADNALRMRWLGLLLLALALFTGVAELVIARAVRTGLSGGPVAVATGLHVDMLQVFIALVLVALAEIFRRGSELESEQSLVI